MKESAKFLICWDLDETLGHFAPLVYDMDGEERPRWDKDVYLAYGIQDVLDKFSEKNGFRSCVTTASMRDYAEFALEQTNLRSYFSDLYARDVTAPYYETTRLYVGKTYEDVAWEHIPYDDYPNRMVVIGDKVEDNPIDMRELVHIYSPGIYFNAMVIRETLVALLEAGNDSFRKGFDVLASRGTREFFDNSSIDAYYHVDIGSGIEIALSKTKGSGPLNDEDGNIPQVYIRSAEDFRKQPTLVPVT
ncbi:MAG: hypothetical protein A2684_02730 [Candidatus Levybacteria bacterium RIFCSPHIGHO2_01_FULL_36_15b]|nr:MAG: hypothetical protein A2684_02730 [Candidatus Levybacteria bacterium RIFCSPHIGHO2_01_FULL_36_15b]